MDKNFKRQEIAAGVFFSTYRDKRFKINRIDVMFADSLNKQTVSLNALIPMMLVYSNNKYKTKRELSRRLSELYSANLGDYVHKLGDNEYFGIYSAFLDDIYALDGESVLTEIAELMCDCIFNPNLENGTFPEKQTELIKQLLIDANNNEINDKALYTKRKGMAVAFEGEPAAISPYGENDDIIKVTAKQLYDQYTEILKTKNIEIMCVGPGDFSTVEKIFTEKFNSLNRTPATFPKIAPSVPKQICAEASEKLDITQSKLYIAFKANYDERITLNFLSNIFGGDVYSKLFTVVREKLSLCYYCHSSLNYSKRTITVECGVEKENIEKAKNAILEQLDEIKKGNFTDDDINKAILSIGNSLKTVGDRISGIASWYLNSIMINTIISPEEEAEMIKTITREQIIEAANSLVLDTVFALTSNEEVNE